MSKMIDMTGKRVGRLVVKHAAGRRMGKVSWLCICDCGNENIVEGWHLRQATVRSCGCLTRDTTIARNETHRMSYTRIYRIYRHMKDRCLNPDDQRYADYGGRGIRICDRWMKFENFRDDMLPTYKPGLTIDRKDNDGNYEPSNCRWATCLEQVYNRRNTVSVTLHGERLTVLEIARRTGLGVEVIRQRIYNGWSAERVMNTPLLIGRPPTSC